MLSHKKNAFSDYSLRSLSSSVEYLRSEQASLSIERDPYWPKWNTPWWHMVILWELGRSDLIPGPIAHQMAEKINLHYLHIFPLPDEELPAGKDGIRHIICHCALGTMYQVLMSCGVDVDQTIPWARPWFIKYQLPDGGLNCDEKQYLKPTPKSSIVSTLPCLEAVLKVSNRPLDKAELQFIDRGADYLIQHQLYKKKSNGMPMDAKFKELIFPRFYKYDILRGLSFLIDWALLRRRKIPAHIIEDCLRIIGDPLQITRTAGDNDRSYALKQDNCWVWEPAEMSDLILELTENRSLPAQLFSSEMARIIQALPAISDGHLCV